MTVSEASRWENMTKTPPSRKWEETAHNTPQGRDEKTPLFTSAFLQLVSQLGHRGVRPLHHRSAALWLPLLHLRDGGKTRKPTSENATQQEITWDQLSFCTTQASGDQKNTEPRHLPSLLKTKRAMLPLTAVWSKQAASPGASWVRKMMWDNVRQGPTALLAESSGVVEGRHHGGVRALFCAYSPGTLDNLSESQLLWMQNGNNTYFKDCFEDDMGDIRKCLSLPQGDLGGTNICLLYPWLPILVLLFSHYIVSNFLWPHGLQHARLPWAFLSPGVCSNSCPLRQWCHQPSHPLSSPSPPAFNLSQHQGVLQWAGSLHQVAKALEL